MGLLKVEKMIIFIRFNKYPQKMKILKYLLFLFLIIVIGSSVYFGTKDGKFDISENKIINAPPQVIFNIVMDFKSWQNWGPWMVIDPNVKINYSAQTKGNGASYAWSSEKQEIGDGSILTIKEIPSKEIQQEISFKTLLGNTKNDLYWYFEPGESINQTKVVWGMKGQQTFMEKVFMSLKEEDMQEGIRKMFQDGLSNLEAVVLQEIEKFSVKIDGLIQYEGGPYMYTTSTAKKNEVHDNFLSNLEIISSFMAKNNIPKTGDPFIIYNEMKSQSENIIFSTCIPTIEKIASPIDSSVHKAELNSLTALKISLKGNRNHLDEVYAEANKFISMNQLTIDSVAHIFEVHISDSTHVSIPNELITEIYIPIIPLKESENNL